MPKEGRALCGGCVYTVTKFLKSVRKDQAEKKRTTQDDVERGFHLIVRPWNEAIRPTENNDRRSALGASPTARHWSS